MMLRDEQRELFFRNLFTVDELLSEFDEKDRRDLKDFVNKHPEMCFRLAEILNRLYRRTIEEIKSH